jgi:hypothetical protein
MDDRKTFLLKLEGDLKNKFHLLCVAEGTNMTEKIKQLIIQYVNQQQKQRQSL